MNSHEIEYTIIGTEMQMVDIELDPGETVVAQAGAMNYMEQDIRYEAKLGDGSDPKQGIFSKVIRSGSRMLAGESAFITHFSNSGFNKRHVGFSAPFPGSIIAVNLADENNCITCQKRSFLAAAMGTKIGITINKRLESGIFSGEGFVLQKLEGDGLAFMHACGTVIEKEINNETLRMDTGCLVAYTGDLEYDVELVSGLKAAMFAGEGLYLTTLKGTGKVWMQSLPFARLTESITEAMPKPEQRQNAFK